MFRPILATTDLVNPSSLALQAAYHWSQTLGTTCTLVHVDTLVDPPRKTLEDYVKDCHVPLDQVTLQRLEGDVADVLTQYAKTHNIGAIFLEGKKQSRLESFIMGSVAEELLQMSPVPLVFPRTPEVFNCKHIGVGCDFSETNGKVLEVVTELAKGLGAEVTLVHVIATNSREYSDQSFLLDDFHNQNLNNLIQSQEQVAFKRLKELSEKVKEAGVTCHVQVKLTFNSDIAEVFIEMTKAHQWHLLALGPHSRSWLDGWPLGSVTTSLVHEGQVSLMVVR